MEIMTKESGKNNLLFLNDEKSNGTESCSDIFAQWLNISHLTEEEFLSFHAVQGVEVTKKISEKDKNFYEVCITYQEEGLTKTIGEPFFICCENETDRTMLHDTVSMLFYMANKLDKEHKKRILHYYELDFNGYENTDDDEDAYAFCIKTQIENISEENALKIAGGVRQGDELTFLREIPAEQAEKFFDTKNLVVYRNLGFGVFFEREPLPKAGAYEMYRGIKKAANPLLKEESVKLEDEFSYLYFTLNVIKFVESQNIAFTNEEGLSRYFAN